MGAHREGLLSGLGDGLEPRDGLERYKRYISLPKIVKLRGKRERVCTYQPFDLETDAVPKESGGTVFGR